MLDFLFPSLFHVQKYFLIVVVILLACIGFWFLRASLQFKNRNALIVACLVKVSILYWILGAHTLVVDTLAVQHIQHRVEEILQRPDFRSQDLKLGFSQIQSEIKSNAFGLSRLSEFYTQMGHVSEAKVCLDEAIALEPKNADYKAELVNLMFMENGDKLSSYAKPILDEALSINPNHPGALNILAIDFYQNGDTAKALEIWERLLKEAPKGSEIEQTLRATIKQIKP